MSDKKEKDQAKNGEEKDLKSFSININEFGEIKSNLKIEELNQFLDENLEDKKLKDRSEDSEEE
jgi:hypothetical protein